MDFSPKRTDAIDELLLKIVEFTRARRKVIIQNINNIHCPGYLPKDVTVEEFCRLMQEAVAEYRRNHHILLRDGAHIKFGQGRSFQVKPLVDEAARLLLEKNCDSFLESQLEKLLENAMNHRIATELLKRRTELRSLEAADLFG